MRGFVALLTVCILSALLLGLALAGAYITFSVRFNETDRESYAQAQSLARSCADSALLLLAQNNSHAPHATTLIYSTNSCTIDSIAILSASGTQREVSIQTSASYHHAYATITQVVAY